MSEGEPTTRAASVEQPKRRRWNRWAALRLALVISCAVWVFCSKSETVRKAGRLRIGMTVAEVEAIMGAPVARTSIPSGHLTAKYATSAELGWIRFRLGANSWLSSIGINSLRSRPTYAVEVHFEPSGRVEWILRGREFVGP
jgi:hypothetical protein